MREFKYKGFNEPIIVDDNENITYRGREVEKYYHGYKAVGMSSGFSVTQLTKAHYISEMKRIDNEIEIEIYREAHKEEFENLISADECIDYFLSMVK
jgi:hypothetical protein